MERKISKLNQEWGIKQRVFNDNIEILRKRKEELAPLIKDVPNALNELNKKEKGIVDGVEKLEQGTRLLQEKEKEFVDKINKMEEMEKSLRKRRI